MKIIGRVNVYWEETKGFLAHKNLCIRVRFKLPNQIFYRKLEKIIVSSNWFLSGRYNSYQNFWDSCIEQLENKNYLCEVAKDMIIKYVKEKYKETNDDLQKKKVLELIEKIKEFEVEVDYQPRK